MRKSYKSLYLAKCAELQAVERKLEWWRSNTQEGLWCMGRDLMLRFEKLKSLTDTVLTKPHAPYCKVAANERKLKS